MTAQQTDIGAGAKNLAATRLALEAFFRAEWLNTIFRLTLLAATAVLTWLLTDETWPLLWILALGPLEFASMVWQRELRRRLDSIANIRRIQLVNDAFGLVLLAGWCAPAWILYMSGSDLERLLALLILCGVGMMVAPQHGRSLPFAVINPLLPAASLVCVNVVDMQPDGGWIQLGISAMVSSAILMLAYVTQSANRALYRARAGQSGLIEDLEAARQEAELRRMQAEKATAAKSDFISIMSHEARTPLNGILAMAQSMKQDNLTERQQQQLRTIHSSGRLLLNIVNDTLDLSRADEHLLEVCAETLDIRELAGEIRDLWEGRASEAGLTLEISVDESAPRYVMADPGRLRQILYNLLSNAIKFTQEGGIILTVSRSGRGDPGNDWLRFDVSDTGVGIDPADIDRIFERFIQAEMHIARRVGGSGLGLAVVRELVTLMGGNISVDSVPGKGTTFHVTLPCLLAPDATVHQDNAAMDSALYQASAGRTFLIVDDTPLNHEVLKALLGDCGTVFLHAYNGQQAIDMVMSPHSRIDLVFMDLRMPGIDGEESVIRMRQRGSSVPVIAMTANQEHVKFIRAGTTGAADVYLAKPLDVDVLHRAVCDCLAKRRDGSSETADQEDSATKPCDDADNVNDPPDA